MYVINWASSTQRRHFRLTSLPFPPISPPQNIQTVSQMSGIEHAWYFTSHCRGSSCSAIFFVSIYPLVFNSRTLCHKFFESLIRSTSTASCMWHRSTATRLSSRSQSLLDRCCRCCSERDNCCLLTATGSCSRSVRSSVFFSVGTCFATADELSRVSRSLWMVFFLSVLLLHVRGVLHACWSVITRPHTCLTWCCRAAAPYNIFLSSPVSTMSTDVDDLCVWFSLYPIKRCMTDGARTLDTAI